MSRQLPPHPNLEHLKKQAKVLLDDLRRRDPAAQLSDAQHALAREYGFASWPKLRAHLEALAGPAPEPRSPFAGRWIPNPRKSKRHPDSPFVAATIELDVAGDTVVVTHVAVDAAGREERGVNTLQADGEERYQGKGYSMLARWRGPRVLEFLARRDGEVVGQGSYEVSADGAALTISGEGQVIVCDRAEQA